MTDAKARIGEAILTKTISSRAVSSGGAVGSGEHSEREEGIG
jgi:hypothetical protein